MKKKYIVKSAQQFNNIIKEGITIKSNYYVIYCINNGDYYVYMMGHFPAPFGNEIRVGVLEALMATSFALVMILSLMGGLKHIFHDVLPEKQNYYFLMIIL